jgi:hypothetical protein
MTTARRYIPLPAKSENRNDYCDLCRDTGFYGDNGAGMRGNREYQPCECDAASRSRRAIARRTAR